MIGLIVRAAAWLPRLLPAFSALAPVAGRLIGRLGTPAMIAVVALAAGAWHWWVVSGLEEDLTDALERATAAEHSNDLLRDEIERQNDAVDELRDDCRQRDAEADARALRELRRKPLPPRRRPDSVEELNEWWGGQ